MIFHVFIFDSNCRPEAKTGTVQRSREEFRLEKHSCRGKVHIFTNHRDRMVQRVKRVLGK